MDSIKNDIFDLGNAENCVEEHVDKISLDMALDIPVWRMIWADEPLREIDVRMTYEDLEMVYGLIKAARGNPDA